MSRYTLLAAAILTLSLAVACDDGNGDGDGTPAATQAEGPALPEQAPGTFAENCVKSDEKQFAEAPLLIIDTAKSYRATITLAKGGGIVVDLFSDVPITTNNFVFLACKGFYDGLTFHRVLPDFVAQGGDPTGQGAGGPGYAIPDEPDGDHQMVAGAISMAKSGPDTTGSQFFVTYTDQFGLDPDFTVFGQLVEGMDVLESITPRDPQTNPDAPPGDAIATVTLTEQ
jgi:cyclophilin family peptidyl-prolyl cis-trans isomerase